MYIVECWIEHPVRKLDQTFTYLSEVVIEQGARIRIDFRNRSLIGFAESCTYTDKSADELKEEYGFALKKVDEVIDENSLITPELHDLALWMRDDTLSTTISCFQVMLPAKVKPQTSSAKIVMEKWVSLSEEEVRLTPKELQAYEYVKAKQPVLYSELRKLFPNQCRRLIEKNAIILSEKERQARRPEAAAATEPLPLSSGQQKAMDEILGSKDDVYLLHGVTGSGKTEVYLQLAAEVLAEGKQVLFLVPEIALTPQMIERVSSRFGNHLAIYHSGLNPQEKYEQYRAVMSDEASVVVGTRSAVFLPFHHLGLIIMDEEHDPSYKQDSQPSYHGRDVAIFRGKYNHCKVILGSATPSLESYARAVKNVYHLVTMDQRINETLPDIHVVPVRNMIRNGQSYILSDELKEKMKDRLEHGKQIILLLNRRGYNTVLRCRSCQEVVMCPHCDIAMSYHRDVQRLKCHTCGTEMRLPKVCPHCGSAAGYSNYGFGTEKLEEEVAREFPSARLLRMDADTTSRKNAHQKLLKSFGSHEADILLGTQMIAKGLDFPNVTLVGVINGDDGLNRTDYRSTELTFDLLMQSSGRSGRGEENGEVVLQVFQPDHYAVESAVRQDYLNFFRNEMQFRHKGSYPPYVYMISLTVTGRNEKQVNELSLDLRNKLKGNFRLIGIAVLPKINDMLRNRIIMKGKDAEEMKQAVREYLNTTTKDVSGLRIDVNPLYLD